MPSEKSERRLRTFKMVQAAVDKSGISLKEFFAASKLAAENVELEVKLFMQYRDEGSVRFAHLVHYEPPSEVVNHARRILKQRAPQAERPQKPLYVRPSFAWAGGR